MDTTTKTRTCQECTVDIDVTDTGTLALHTREHKVLGEVHCTGSGKSSVPPCEVVDQIVSWTDKDGRLNIHEGDLILDGSSLELIAEIELGLDGGAHYMLEGRDRSFSAAGDELVAVRRYVETTEK